MTDKQREKLAELLGPKRMVLEWCLTTLWRMSCVPKEPKRPAFVSVVLDPAGDIRLRSSPGAIRQTPGDFIVAGMMQTKREFDAGVARAFVRDHVSRMEAELEIAG